MTKENLIPKTETVYELKNEIPSFEEFMKSYEENEGVENSYTDELESYDGVGKVKGYGPTTYGQERCMVCYNGRTYEYQHRFLVILESE